MKNEHAELSADEGEAIGLDSTGRFADERFPYTEARLTTGERALLHHNTLWLRGMP